jgi:hypothetical protein
MKWKLLFKIPGGHKYFRGEDGRVAVADDSGTNPENTDGAKQAGVLYVQLDSAIEFGTTSAAIYCYEEVTPLKYETAKILESPPHGLAIARIFNMPIRFCGMTVPFGANIDPQWPPKPEPEPTPKWWPKKPIWPVCGPLHTRPWLEAEHPGVTIVRKDKPCPLDPAPRPGVATTPKPRIAVAWENILNFCPDCGWPKGQCPDDRCPTCRLGRRTRK